MSKAAIHSHKEETSVSVGESGVQGEFQLEDAVQWWKCGPSLFKFQLR